MQNEEAVDEIEIPLRFKIGDIVQLKSGGPPLVVARHATANGQNLLIADYFNEVTGFFSTVELYEYQLKPY